MKSPCNKCKDKSCEKTGKPCQQVEGILNKNKIWSADWIRPRVNSRTAKHDGLGKWREIPFSSLRYETQVAIGINNDSVRLNRKYQCHEESPAEFPEEVQEVSE